MAAASARYGMWLGIATPACPRDMKRWSRPDPEKGKYGPSALLKAASTSNSTSATPWSPATASQIRRPGSAAPKTGQASGKQSSINSGRWASWPRTSRGGFGDQHQFARYFGDRLGTSATPACPWYMFCSGGAGGRVLMNTDTGALAIGREAAAGGRTTTKELGFSTMQRTRRKSALASWRWRS